MYDVLLQHFSHMIWPRIPVHLKLAVARLLYYVVPVPSTH